MLTASAAVHLLYGASYAESAVMFRIYLFLVPLRVATYGLITQAIGRTRINLTASFVFLGSNAILVLALVGPLGLPGPAVATVAATTGVACYYLVRLRRGAGSVDQGALPVARAGGKSQASTWWRRLQRRWLSSSVSAA